MNQKYNLNNITIIEEGQICRNEQLYFYEHWVQVIFFCLYAAIFMVGVGGNLVVIGVILGNKHMRTTINLYLLNLASSDIIMSVFASSKLMGRWRFLGHGDWMCKLTITSMALSVCMSTFTLAAIAVNRFLAVFYPFRSRNNSVKITVAIIFSINLVAIIINLPQAVFVFSVQDWNLQIPDKKLWNLEGPTVCFYTFTEKSDLIYTSFVQMSQFVVPFTIIVICYTSIVIKLRHRTVERSMSMEQMQGEAARNKRMNKMLILVTIIFGICWFPGQLSLMIFFYDDFLHCWTLRDLTMYILHVLAMSSTCYNPFLYGFMNPAFKEAFAKLCSYARKTSL